MGNKNGVQFGMWPQTVTTPAKGEGNTGGPGVPALGVRGWCKIKGTDATTMYNSGLVQAAAVRTSAGLYQVPIPVDIYTAMGANDAVALATCNAAGMYVTVEVGASPDLTVRTFDDAGVATDSDFSLLVLWRGN